jgi:hypothetical protein
LLLILSGCASTTADILIGAPVADRGFVGHGPTATLRIKRHLTDRTWCEFEHVSFPLAGPPFGPQTDEDSLNQIACGLRFGGND